MSNVNARAGIVAVTDMPFIKAGTIYGSSMLADFDASTVYGSAANAVPSTGTLSYDNTTPDSWLGFPNAIGYAFEPAAPVITDTVVVDPDDLLVYNLPIDTSQIIALIQQQIADLQLTAQPGQVTYDTLPDPGSFIPEFISNL